MTVRRRSAREDERTSGSLAGRAIAIVISCLAFLLAVPGGIAAATVTHQDITSSGPLTLVGLGNELSCQVEHAGDTSYEFYPPSANPGDCGTFLVVGGSLFAPNFAAHSGTATSGLGSYTAFTPVSQSGVEGSGTSSDPYRVVTVVDAGSTGVRLTRTDSYVVGEESYQTDVVVSNGSSSAQSVVLYEAGDCYLAGSDVGTGVQDTTTNAIGCKQPTGSRVEEFVPITSSSQYLETTYSGVWSAIATHHAFPDACDCSMSEDNGAGVSWTASMPAAATQTFSNITSFSPTGKLPLSANAVADSAEARGGDLDGYTVTIHNPNTAAVTIESVTVTLPPEFTYVPGSSSGVEPSDATVSGSTLTWTTPFNVAGNSDASLHFLVRVATETATYTADVDATADAYSVAPSGPSAPIGVTSACDPATLTGSSANDKLTGSAAVDRIVGGSGKDVVDALGGSDVVCGDGGSDTLYGRDGLDVVQGGSGDDRMYGGAGNDTLLGGPGHDAIFTGSGTDTVIADDGEEDCIVTSSPHDSVTADPFDLRNPAGGCPPGFWLQTP